MAEPSFENPRRKALQVSVASLLSEVGFDSAEPLALETLCEMLQSFIFELGNSSRAYCELSGRTAPVIGDIVISLVGMGVPVTGIEAHAKRPNRSIVLPPQASAQPKQPSTLTAGTKQTPPAHIPDYLPSFPDPHAYIRTPTHKQPVTEYEAIREKSAIQKRDVERALTRFVAKTGDQHSLFATADNNNMFPLIATKCTEPAYLTALCPRDQVFDFDETDFETRKSKDNEDSAMEKSEEPVKPADTDAIDNPYLRSVKMPRKLK